MATLVRMDLQLTQEEAADVARLLGQKLSGFLPAFQQMLDRGTAAGTHYEMLYRSEDAQRQFAAEGQ